MEQIHLSVFTARMLSSFCEAKEQICTKIIQLSNQDNIDFDEISYEYSNLAKLAELEIRFLQFVNSCPDHMPMTEIENYREFFRKFTEGRIW